MAGTRIHNRLTALAVEKQRTPGTYPDGAGLSLVVTDRGVKRWELRIQVGARRRQLGLGLFPKVSLDAARRKASVCRREIEQGLDISKRDRPKAVRTVTFRNAFECYFDMKEQQLSNPKHAAQWRSTMETYVFPSIGSRGVGDVTASDIIDILKPIWNVKPETAKRVLQRMRVVFEAAIVRGDRTTPTPTTGVSTVLGGRRNVWQSHHAALPFREVPAFMRRVHKLSGWPATRLAFEFLVLTAARSNEVRSATWAEIDSTDRVGVIPAARMKARDPHVVPLSSRAFAILEMARAAFPDNALIFPGTKPGRPLSDMTLTKVLRDAGLGGRATAHGFRSSFKDWCAEIAKVRDEVSEAALAHKIPDKGSCSLSQNIFSRRAASAYGDMGCVYRER
ncbi:MAG: tyrosine-type recombinase/integrase [Hyphomicrobiales bacterium]|nr:tyrosine-type recombinase/integrase [Hyphomicrobiales bacterium]